MFISCHLLTSKKENIVKYERAFRLPSGQTCIVMELAVNDLETCRKARHSDKRRSCFSLPCIRSIGQQALSGLSYLHGKGFMHRDLKPQNILVTKWDARTDTPTIKLADFGLAGIGSEHQTICGTEGYMAPEIIQAGERAKALQKHGDRWIKTAEPDWLPTYTNAVDIWALGKILDEFLEDVPSHVSLLRGKRVLVNKEPALRLIDRMMQHDASRRPTAAECLTAPWMATTDTSDSRLARKRGRSPTPSTSGPTSNSEQPLRKVMRSALAHFSANNESSTIMIMNAIWSFEGSYQDGSARAPRGAPPFPDVDMERVEEGQIQPGHSQATQLTIQLEDGRLSLTANSHNNVLISPLAAARDEHFSVAVLADHAGPRGASSSMQDVTRRLLTALQAEGYGDNVAVAGNSTGVGVVREEISRLSILSLQARQESQSSIVLGLEFDREEWTSSFQNEAQFSVGRSVGSQSANPAGGHDAAAYNNSRPRSCLEVMFSRDPRQPLFDQSSYHQPEPVTHLDHFSVPAITVDDDQMPRPLIHGSMSQRSWE